MGIKDLEFEMEEIGTIQSRLIFTITRKGLYVGTLTLNRDPYEKVSRDMRMLRCSEK